MADYGDAFDTLADSDGWYKIGIAAAGFAGATVAQNVVESRGTDLPDEVYGAGAMAGSAMFLSGDMQKFAVIGGGLHTVEALARRVGIKSTVNSVGQGGN
jgi:hypothetical protein